MSVVILPVTTRLDLPPQRIMDGIPADMESIIVIGFNADGSEYFASSYADGGDVIWLLERTKHKLIRAADDE